MISQSRLKRLAKLKQKKYREEARLFLAEGSSLIGESKSPPVEIFDEPGAIRRLSSLTTPAGPVALFRFLDVAASRLIETRQRVVLLHGVQDPGNVGTIIRAAHAFEAGAALSKGCADLYNPKTVRATMGSIFHIPIARELDSLELIEQAHLAGYTTVATTPSGGKRPDSLPDEKLLFVVGSEGKGLPEEMFRSCQLQVTIPSCAASLNAAVAASILLYQAYMRVLP